VSPLSICLHWISSATHALVIFHSSFFKLSHTAERYFVKVSYNLTINHIFFLHCLISYSYFFCRLKVFYTRTIGFIHHLLTSIILITATFHSQTRQYTVLVRSKSGVSCYSDRVQTNWSRLQGLPATPPDDLQFATTIHWKHMDVFMIYGLLITYNFRVCVSGQIPNSPSKLYVPRALLIIFCE